MMTAAIRRPGPRSRPAAWCASTPSARTSGPPRAVALAAAGGAPARELARWRERMRAAWPGVAVRSAVAANGPVAVGSEVQVEALVRLGGLAVDDVAVEVVAGDPDGEGGLSPRIVVPAAHRGAAGGEERFVAEVPAVESARRGVAGRPGAPERRRRRPGLPDRLGPD
jgi:starch phosphorylase